MPPWRSGSWHTRAILFKLVAPTCTNELQPRQFAMMDIWRCIQKLEGSGNFLSWYDLAAVDPQKKYGIVTRLRSTHLSTWGTHSMVLRMLGFCFTAKPFPGACMARLQFNADEPTGVKQTAALCLSLWSSIFITSFYTLAGLRLAFAHVSHSPYLCSFEAWICLKTCGHISSLVYQVPQWLLLSATYN